MKSWIIFACIGLIASVWIASYIYKYEYREHVLEVHFLNLDKGRSIFMRTPEGKTILIDGGANSSVLRDLSKLVPFYRRHIDIVISRSDSDRSAGGLLDVIDRYDVGTVIVPDMFDYKPATMSATTSKSFSSLKRSTAAKTSAYGDIVYKEGDLVIKTVFPNKDFKYSTASQPELVLEIIYKNTSMLLLGDVTPSIQNFIAKTVKKKYSLVEFANSGTTSRVSSQSMEIFDPDITVVYSPKLADRHFISDGLKLPEK